MQISIRDSGRLKRAHGRVSFRRLFSPEVLVILLLMGCWVGSSAAQTNPFSPGPDLELYKTDYTFGDADGNGYPSPGDTICYEITLVNEGDEDLSGICVTDRPDSNTALIVGSTVSSSGPATILVGNDPGDDFVRVCVDDLPAGDTATVTFCVAIDDPLPPGECYIYDQGEAISAELPVELTDDPDTYASDDPTVTYVCGLPLLDVCKMDSLYIDADGNGYPSEGDTLLYHIIVSNTGNMPVTQSCLLDTPDVNTGLVIGSIITTQGNILDGNDPGDTRLRVCFGTIVPGQSITIYVQVAIDDPLFPGVTEISDQGWVFSFELPAEPSDDCDTPEQDDPTRTPVGDSPLIEAYKHDVLFIDADGDGLPGSGDLLLYTISIYNHGYGPATGVIYTDTIDANTSMVTNAIGTVFTSQGVVTSGNTVGDTVVQVFIGTLDPLSLVEITFQVTINDPVTSMTVENQGFVASNEVPDEPTDDPETPADDDPTITPLNVAPQLVSYKDDVLVIDADGNGIFSPGDTLQYEVIIQNMGDISATGVTFYDLPDASTELVVGSVTKTQGTVLFGNGPGHTFVVVDVGTISPGGGTATITFDVTIPAEITLSIQPPVSIDKPDSHFTVCLDVACFEETSVADQGVISSNELDDVLTDDLDTPAPLDSTATDVGGVELSGITYTLTFDTTIITFDSTITFMETCLESLGWYPAWNFGVTHDTLKFWLLGGGNSTTCCGCYAYLGFHVDDTATPGDTSLIHFEDCQINEGDPLCTAVDGIFIVNRPPVFDALNDTIYFIEAHEQCFTVSASDPDNDYMIMWAVIDSCAEATGARLGLTDTVTGIGSVEAEFCWCPIKEDSCDTVDVMFLVKSTMPDSLMDTLNVTIIVNNTFIHGMFPDTSYYPCGWMEQFFCIDPNYVSCLDTFAIFSLDVVLSFDPECIDVTEVGHVGTLTENWGTITYNIVGGNIFVSLSGNDTLEWCDTTVAQDECVNLFYVGFTVNPEALPGDTCWLCIEHVKVNEGWPPSYWGMCTEVGCAAIAIECLSISGTVAYCSTDVAIPNVEMILYGDAADTVLTDASGHYEFPCVFACGEYCVKPDKDWLPNQVVNSFDGSLIMQSLCHQLTLNDCQEIAADVSGDGTITGYDVALLLRWRVGIPVPGYTGEWTFGPDSLCYSFLTEHQLDQDYWGLVIGDVSFNWPGDGPPKQMAESAITWPEVAAMPGQTFTLPISMETDVPVYSLDLSVVYDGAMLRVIEVIPSALPDDAITAHMTGDGEIRLAVAGARPMAINDIVSIVFEVSEQTAAGTSMPLEATVVLNESHVISRSQAIPAEIALPTEFGLAQNYPNPFNPTTSIQYAVGSGQLAVHVTLKIFNVLGQEVAVLVDGVQEPGYYTAIWEGKDSMGAEVASGVYYYRLEADDYSSTRCMLLLK